MKVYLNNYESKREEVECMPKVRVKAPNSSKPKPRRPITDEARESQLISMAMDLVEQRLLDGTASSQETTHFLKLGSSKAKYEMERLQEENKLLRAKTEALKAAEESKIAYEEVIKALKNYSGQGDEDEYDYY